MWGALTNKAQQLAAIAAEQAQKGLTQANQLLEKLDGLDDEELENDENDEGVENNDKAEDSEDVVKNLDQDADSNEISPLTPFAPRRNETIRDKEVNNEEDDDKEDDFFTPMKEPVKKKPHFDMSYTIDEGESTVDDELDQLVLEDDLEVQPIVEVATAQSNLEENKESMAAGDLGHLQYEKLESELLESRGEIALLQSVVDNLKSAEVQSLKALETAQTEAQESQKRFETTQSISEQSQTELKNLKKTFESDLKDAEMQAGLAVAEAEEHFEQALKEAKAKADSENANNNLKSENKLKALEESLEASKEETKALLESSDKLKLKIFELEKSENDKEELNKSSDQFGIKISELKDALGLLKNENKELSDKFSNSSNHNEALRASNVSLMSELEIIKDEFLTSKDGREELTIKCGNFESEIEGLNSKLLINDENSEKQIKVLGEELGDLKRDEEVMKARCAVLVGEVGSLQSLLKDMGENSENNDNEDIKNEEIKILSTERNDLIEKFKSLEVEFTKVSSEYDISQDKLNALNEENVFLNNVVNTFEKKEIDMKSVNEKTENERNSLILELKELKVKSNKKEFLRKKLTESEEKCVVLAKEKQLLENNLSACEERLLEGDGKYLAKEEELRVHIEQNEIEVRSRQEDQEKTLLEDEPTDDNHLLLFENSRLKEELLEMENIHLDEINQGKDEISKHEGMIKNLELKLATDEVYIKNKEMEYDALKASQGGDDTDDEVIRNQLNEANMRLEEVMVEYNDTKMKYEELEIKSNKLEALQIEFQESLLLSESVHRDLQSAYDEHQASTDLAAVEYKKSLESQLEDLDAKDVIICDLTNSHIDEMKKIQNELVNFEGKYVHLDETKNVIISDLKSNYDDVHKKLEKNENEIIELQDFLTKTEMLNNEQMNNFLTIEKNHKLKINEMDDNFEAEIDELRTLLNNKINVLIDQKNIQVLSVEKELKENKEKLNNAEMKINEMHEEIMNDSIPLQEEVRMKYENQIIELEYIINEKNEKNLLYDILVTDYENLKGEKIEFIDVIGKYESDQGLLKASCEEKEKLLQTSSSEIRELHDNVDNQNRIIKDVNDKLNININEIQDRIIENVSLREDIKNVNLQLLDLEKCFERSEQNVISLNTQLIGSNRENESNYDNAINEKNIILEEMEYYKTSYKNMEIEFNQNSAQFTILNSDIKNLKFNENDYLMRLRVAESAGKRICEVEEQLSKVEEKKKRDLENLKKQNERIAVMQRNNSEAERLSAETIQDLRLSVENSETNILNLNIIINNTKKEFNDVLEKNRILEDYLGGGSGSDADTDVRVLRSDILNILKGRGDCESETSLETNGSFVVVGGGLGDNGEGGSSASEEKPSTKDMKDPVLMKDPILTMAESKLEIAAAEIQLLKDQLLEKDEQLTTKYAYYRHEELRQLEEKKEVEGVGGGGEAATELAIQPSAPEGAMEELRTEIAHLQGLNRESQIQIQNLEGERVRLEADSKEFERSMSQAMSAPPSASIHRQRPEKNFDIEGGQSTMKSNTMNGTDEDKKGEVGYHPFLAHIWSLVTRVCPMAVQCIGEKPPRVSTIGQLLVLYFVCVHLYLWWVKSHCM